MWREAKAVLKTITLVLRHPAYLIAATMVAAIAFWIYVWVPNFSFFAKVVFSADYTFSGKLDMVIASFGYFNTGFSTAEKVLTIANAALIGISLTLGAYYVSNRASALSTAGLSGLGMIASLLGVGCSSCGSVLLSSLIGIGGATEFTHRLPFGGYTFDVLGTLLVLSSIYFTAHAISGPAVCEPVTK
ncbi:MAG: hypothetical protein M1153_02080 [Patescibacteria group bacterium]|nr:hypothetical protein [Patescibacteria group bacterium]